jgi:intron-binding protein aquarius
MGSQMRPAMVHSLETRPTVRDLQDDNHWVGLAKTHWLKEKQGRKLNQETIKKDIWEPLESEGFTLHSLLVLENLHILEK